MASRWTTMLCAVVVIGLAAGTTVSAVEPADPDLIPEAVQVFEYLQQVKGKGILVGGPARTNGGPRRSLHQTGRQPAIRHLQANFFLVPASAEQTFKAATRWWHDMGGIVQFLNHVPSPTGGSAWKGKPRGARSTDLEKTLTPGTDEYKAFHRDLGVIANYLERLAQARVPVLWAPYHEIDGGWFWWTDVEKPEKTAVLWRRTFNYLVKEREIHNLIWVYQAAHVAHRRGAKDDTFEEEIAYRARFYAGDDYVDVASLSTYGNRQLGWGAAYEEAREPAYRLMQGVAPGPGKNGMLPVGECPGLLNPVVAQRDGPDWLWCLTWFGGASSWDRFTWNHEYFITLDELPLLHEGNVTPNVRITQPAEGIEARAADLHILGVATDRNHNLESVSVHALAGPWMNWPELGGSNYVRAEEPVLEAFEDATCLGEAQPEPHGRWSFTWHNPPVGFHNLVAFARDREGAVACSNVVRITAGLENLARNRPATASPQKTRWGGPAGDAVDDDPSTAWWVHRREDDPQWLRADLGAEQVLGAVSVHWRTARATHYTVDVSDDGEQWREVVRVEDGKGHMDIHRFVPVRARYVRLHCTKRATNWQAYCVYDFAVYEEIPEQD